MKCSHCSKSNAGNRWQPTLCADGRKQRSKWLCDPCDHMLNRFVLEFFNYPNVDQKMAEYTGGNEMWGQQSCGVAP